MVGAVLGCYGTGNLVFMAMVCASFGRIRGGHRRRQERGSGMLAFTGTIDVGTWLPVQRSAFWGGHSGLGVFTWSSPSSVLSLLLWGRWHPLVHLSQVVSAQVSWQGEVLLTGALRLSRHGRWAVSLRHFRGIHCPCGARRHG